MDWSSLIPWICQSLNAATVGELGQWSEVELYQYAEESLHDIGGKYVLIATYDESIALVADQALYELPTLHIVTLYAAADGVMLKPSSVAELESLDQNWEEAASSAPTRWVGNALGLKRIGVYPPKNGAGVLALVYQEHPPDLTPAAAEVKMPAAIGDYLAVKALQQARERQGDGQLPDASQAFGVLATIYENAIKAYWGEGS